TSSVTTPSGGHWLTLTSPSFNGNGSFFVNANPAGLAAGTYFGTVTISSAQSANGNVVIPVTLIVTTAPTAITLNRNGILFTTPTLGVDPASQTFTITNTGAGTLNWTLTAASTEGW